MLNVFFLNIYGQAWTLSFRKIFNCFYAFSIMLLIWIVHLQSELKYTPKCKIYTQVYMWGNRINLDIIKIKIWVKLQFLTLNTIISVLSGLSLTSHWSDHFDRLLKVYIRQVDEGMFEYIFISHNQFYKGTEIITI